MSLVVFAVGLAATIWLAMAFRASRLALSWGALWGSVIGTWTLAPLVLQIHDLRPLTLAQWVAVDAALVTTFVLLGSLLSFLICLPITAWQAVRSRIPRRPDLLMACAVIVLLPVAYFGFAAQLERATFRRPIAIWGYRHLFFPALLLEGALAMLLVVWYRRAARRKERRSEWGLRAACAAAVCAGLCVLPFRTLPSPLSALVVPEPVVRRADTSGPAAPVLFIGLDAGNWRTIAPLVEAGRLPTIGSLMRLGLHGDVPALWPPYWSAPAWGAILTGYSIADIGVHHDLAASAPGLPPFALPLEPTPVTEPVFFIEFNLFVQSGLIRPAFHPREALRREPIWERLGRAGVKTAVVRLPFTYPAAGQGDVVISNRIVPDLWSPLGVERGRPNDLVAPASETSKWLDWFSPTRQADASLQRQVLPRRDWTPPRDVVMDPVAVLDQVLDNDDRVLRAAREIVVGRPDLGLVMVHLAGFDSVCHAFWPYRFPEDFPDDPPRPGDIDAAGQVIDRYLEFLDARLGELIAAFPSRPSVVIVSDHGHEASLTHPLWRGWHSANGIAVVSGPGVASSPTRQRVSYFDIVPTLMDLAGFEPAPGLRGQSIRTLARPVR